MPCIRIFSHILSLFVLTIISFHFVLLNLKRSHSYMPVGVRLTSIKRFAKETCCHSQRGQVLLIFLEPCTCGHRFQITWRILFLFCAVVYACTSIQALLLTDNLHLFLCLSIRDGPRLILGCFPAKTLGQGRTFTI